MNDLLVNDLKRSIMIVFYDGFNIKGPDDLLKCLLGFIF